MEQKATSNGGPDRPARNVGSRKRARAFPKGRQLEVQALSEVRELLGSRPRRPDLLIEFLHLIQDRYHYLSAAHLRALCDEMRLPQAAVYEVATFYSHFDVVKEGELLLHLRPFASAIRSPARSREPRRCSLRSRPRPTHRRYVYCARPAWEDAILLRFAKLDIVSSTTPRLDPWRPYCEAGNASPGFPLIKISPSICQQAAIRCSRAAALAGETSIRL